MYSTCDPLTIASNFEYSFSPSNVKTDIVPSSNMTTNRSEAVQPILTIFPPSNYTNKHNHTCTCTCTGTVSTCTGTVSRCTCTVSTCTCMLTCALTCTHLHCITHVLRVNML